MEIWKPVKDFEGFYEVSNMGRVKSLSRTVQHKHSGKYTFKERILKPNPVKGGYHQVTLNKNSKRYSKYIHVLVMQMFVGEKTKGYEVNHIDENVTNNKLENLEYLTPKENNNYGNRTIKATSKLLNGKKSKPVIGTSIDGKTKIEFPSMNEARRQGFGTHISDAINGKRNSSGGYTWKLK